MKTDIAVIAGSAELNERHRMHRDFSLKGMALSLSDGKLPECNSENAATPLSQLHQTEKDKKIHFIVRFARGPKLRTW